MSEAEVTISGGELNGPDFKVLSYLIKAPTPVKSAESGVFVCEG